MVGKSEKFGGLLNPSIQYASNQIAYYPIIIVEPEAMECTWKRLGKMEIIMVFRFFQADYNQDIFLKFLLVKKD